VLAANSIFNVLNPQFVERCPIALDVPFAPRRPDGVALGCTVTAFPVPGKVALWLEDTARGVDVGAIGEDTVALEISDDASGRRFYYIPACARMTPELADRLRGAALVLFDGTLWVDDEMIRDRVGVKTGTRMGHLSVSGPGGTLEAFRGLDVARRVFIHINTTNPILAADSPERAAVEAAGWEVACDGMHITL
jgi:pyrroloquinoline quinone biosynthesis protein B